MVVWHECLKYYDFIFFLGCRLWSGHLMDGESLAAIITTQAISSYQNIKKPKDIPWVLDGCAYANVTV